MRASERQIRSRFATVIAAGWLAIVGLLTFVVPASNRYTGRFVSISEKAQVIVLRDGRPESLRLAEVELPEKGQPHARAARAFANRLALGRDVFVEESRLGDGKRVAYVTLPGGENLGAALVGAGLAWPSWQHAGPLASSLAALQVHAMSSRRGLWGDARTPPVARVKRAVRRSRSAEDLASLGGDDPEGEDADGAMPVDDATGVETGTATLGAN